MKRETARAMLLTKYINNEFVRFLAIGVVNTFGTYVIYLLLLLLVSHNIAYTLSYIIGIVFAFVLNSKFTFKVKLSLKKMLRYPLVYLVQYLINLFMLNLIIFKFSINEEVAPVIVITLSIPISFILSKLILK